MKRQRATLSNILKNSALTEFERSVYTSTLAIPRGQTRSYKWIAEKIGRPRSYRAVGNALNKNPYVTIVPCHRVVKSDGSLGGYALGSRLKKKILKSEGAYLGSTLRQSIDSGVDSAR